MFVSVNGLQQLFPLDPVLWRPPTRVKGRDPVIRTPGNDPLLCSSMPQCGPSRPTRPRLSSSVLALACAARNTTSVALWTTCVTCFERFEGWVQPDICVPRPCVPLIHSIVFRVLST